MSDTTDSQGSIVFVTEKKVVVGELHHSPHPLPETLNATPETVHVPETLEDSQIPQNNTTSNHPEDDDDCIMVIPETTGKYTSLIHKEYIIEMIYKSNSIQSKTY